MRYVEYEQHGAVVVIRANRPERGNALGSHMITDLIEASDRFRDDDSARVAIWTGVDQFFCGGLDLKQVVELGNPFIDPRTADRTQIGSHPVGGRQSFTMPPEWEDAVLLLSSSQGRAIA